MKKILVMPDSFKGTMPSGEVCSIMESAVLKNFKDAQVISIPVADGGEGSVDAFLAACGGKKVSIRVKDPYFEEIEAFYGLIDEDRTTVIEMAACAGLPLVKDCPDPSKTTTFGVGQMIDHALSSGCRKMIVCLGGSATNDGGTGAAAALGTVFKDRSGKAFIPVGATLNDIAKIDNSELANKIKGVEIITMCDIDNPLYGESGAAYIFGPQKGAPSEMVAKLDEGLRNLDKRVIEDLKLSIAQVPGAGAAGGMGFGMMAFFGAELKMGIETILDAVNFDELLYDTDFVLTGEGRIDAQTVRGKVVAGIAKRAKKVNVPVIAIVGDIGDKTEPLYEQGVTGIFSINRVAAPYETAKLRSKDDLYFTVDNIMRFIRALEDR